MCGSPTCRTVSVHLGGMTEKNFQANVEKAAKLLDWLNYHTYHSGRSEEGFPDLVLVRERIVWAELKTDSPKSQATPKQREWLSALADADEEVYLWRPRHWEEIVVVLQRQGRGDAYDAEANRRRWETGT